MKKLLAILFAIFLAILLPVPAPAEEIKTEALTLTLPAGWTYDMNDEGNISMVSPHGALVTLTALDATTSEAKEDLDPRSVATFLREELRESGAEASEVTEERGVFSFTVGDAHSFASPASIFRFSIEKNKWFVMIIIQGASDLAPIEKILASIRYN